MVPGMSDNQADPSGNTEQFQAFASASTSEPGKSRTPLLVGAALAVVAGLFTVLVVFLALR